MLEISRFGDLDDKIGILAREMEDADNKMDNKSLEVPWRKEFRDTLDEWKLSKNYQMHNCIVQSYRNSC